MMVRAKTTDQKLNQQIIIDAAFELLDEVGLNELTIRKLASKLGIQNATIYWYFKNKEDLLSSMKETIVVTFLSRCEQAESWQGWLRNLAYSLRTVCLEHRDSYKLATAAPITTRLEEKYISQYHAPLIASGIKEKDAHEAITILLAFVAGWLAYEQSQEYNEMLSPNVNFTQSFQFGIDAIITGLEKKWS